jgi:dihydroorotate dehydrogenase
MIAKQGAGFYLGGTGTWDARLGNTRGGIHLPFAIYPRSHAASNSLGLPNDGDKENAGRAVYLERTPGCPVGWSVMGSSSLKDEEKLPCLVDGMRLYDAAGVDFLELNESCPNTDHGKPQDNGLVDRLHYIAQHFLSHRRHTRRMPVVVKFSNDTHPQQVPALVELLINFGFDGVNFGNTSTAYPRYHQIIDPAEQKLFDYYTTTFGGGISGRPLRDISLALSAAAVKAVQEKKPKQDFHVIRTGGVETWEDVQASLDAGVALVGWFTGYFHGFGKHGHDVYKNLYAQR